MTRPPILSDEFQPAELFQPAWLFLAESCSFALQAQPAEFEVGQNPMELEIPHLRQVQRERLERVLPPVQQVEAVLSAKRRLERIRTKTGLQTSKTRRIYKVSMNERC